MKALFDEVSIECSKITTKKYSTSFSLGISCLDEKYRNPIYAIYGFVRFADEIVDTFHDYDKADLLKRFKEDTYVAIKEGISLNPILNSFQQVVNEYNIDHELIETFLRSMEMDLDKSLYNQENFEEYILGSAEVVGLMCLKIFVEGDMDEYNRLKFYSMRLGSAFQKINFLRDLNADYLDLGRSYFPALNVEAFDKETKHRIELDIEKDFQDGYEGIIRLPKGARFGVYMAYIYYKSLFNKIRKTAPAKVLHSRIRIPNPIKYLLFLSSYVRHKFNMI